MVRKIKISSVYEAEPEEASEPTNAEADEVQTPETANTQTTEAIETYTEQPKDEPPKIEEPGQSPDCSRSKQPARQSKGKVLTDMPTTPKILQQVECQACFKKMSAKNLMYSHPKYCTAREQEEEQPEEIPIPKMEIMNDAKIKNKESLPVKKHTLKRTQSTTQKQETSKAETEPIKAGINYKTPDQTADFEHSYLYKMHQRIQIKNEKYQTMMSNAF